jgi:uncharacterized protein (DUF433 family)
MAQAALPLPTDAAIRGAQADSSFSIGKRGVGGNGRRTRRLRAGDILKTMASRIMIEPGKRSGQPCIRGLRITVWDVLNWLAAGMTEQQILDDYPELESEDFRAVYEFAAKMGRRVAL